MRQKEINIAPVAVDPNGIAEAQTQIVAAPTALVLDGVLISGGIFTGDYARRLGILSSVDDSGITFTVVGTDADGKALTEIVTGSAGGPGTAETSGYFKTVSSVTASAAAAGNVSVGTVDEFVLNSIPLNSYNSDGCTVSIEAITGTIDLSIEQTFSRVQYSEIVFQPGPSALTAITELAAAEMDIHASAVRCKVNSYTTGATLRMVVNQNRCN